MVSKELTKGSDERNGLSIVGWRADFGCIDGVAMIDATFVKDGDVTDILGWKEEILKLYHFVCFADVRFEIEKREKDL